MFIPQTATTELVNVKLTRKGRELLAKGINDRDVFDIIKFAFGDSEINYGLTNSQIDNLQVQYADGYVQDLKSKLYVSGTIPNGTPYVTLSQTDQTIPKNESVSVQVSSFWPPVEGEYIEPYTWTNLGPLNDWDFDIRPVSNTRSANIVAYDVAGTSRIRVKGQLTGRYAILNITIQ